MKKGQAGASQYQEGVQGEVRLVERCFHVGEYALAEVMKIVNAHFQTKAS